MGMRNAECGTKRKGGLSLGICAALAALALAALTSDGRAAKVDPDRLPLPPAPEVPVLPAPASGASPEVLWADSSTASEALPSVPLMTINKHTAAYQPPAAAADVPVDAVLDAVRQEAPKAATLESMLFEQLHAAMPEGSEGYIFEKIALPNIANLPAQGWKVAYDFRLPPRGVGPASFSGRITGAEGQTLRTFTGSVQIDREAAGVQVTRVIRRGEAIAPGDVRLMGTRLSLLPRGGLDQIDNLSGVIARQELRPGMWLTDMMIKVPEVIRQGQPVTMILMKGPIRITAPAIARKAGAMGETIQVENTQSKRMVYARVMSRDEVQVVF